MAYVAQLGLLSYLPLPHQSQMTQKKMKNLREILQNLEAAKVGEGLGKGAGGNLVFVSFQVTRTGSRKQAPLCPL